MKPADSHTPGPWSVDDYGDVIANGEDVARIATYEHAQADARLIAAAPELFDALLALVNHTGEYRDGSATELWTNAYDALAKATRP